MPIAFRVYPNDALEAIEVRDLWRMFLEAGHDLIEEQTIKYEKLAFGQINPTETIRFALSACKAFLAKSRIVLWERETWEVAISGFRDLTNKGITESFLAEVPTNFESPLLWFWRGASMSEPGHYRRIGELVFPSLSTVDGAKQMSTLGLVLSADNYPAIAYTQGPSVGQKYGEGDVRAMQQAAALMFMRLPDVAYEVLPLPRQARRLADRQGIDLPQVYTMKKLGAFAYPQT